MNKTIHIITLALITTISLGGFFLFSSYISSYQNAYQAFVIKNKTLLLTEQITINPHQLYTNTKAFIWEDGNKEVLVNDILFDIISMKFIKGKVILTVIRDVKEQQFKKDFASNYDITNSKSTNPPIKLIRQFLALKFLNEIPQSINLIYSAYNCNKYSLISIGLKTIFLSIDTPPPIFS